MSKFKENEVAYTEQILSMREDGKTYAEIRQFFQDNYKIKLYDSEIARRMKGKKISKSPRVKVGKRSKANSPRKTIIEGECTFKIICKFAEICRPEICKFKGA